MSLPRSVAAHRDAVVELLSGPAVNTATEQLPLLEALGKVLAVDLHAPLSLPPFANSQMDGFAVNSADIPDDGAKLRVAAPVPAGAAPEPLKRALPRPS